MTLLVGIRCEGGVVVASDSAAAYTSGSLITIGQQEVQKVHKVSDDLVYASTGAIGVSQLIIAELTKIDGQKYFSKSVGGPVQMASLSIVAGAPKVEIADPAEHDAFIQEAEATLREHLEKQGKPVAAAEAPPPPPTPPAA